MVVVVQVSAVTEHLKGGGMASIAANIKNLHGAALPPSLSPSLALAPSPGVR